MVVVIPGSASRSLSTNRSSKTGESSLTTGSTHISPRDWTRSQGELARSSLENADPVIARRRIVDQQISILTLNFNTSFGGNLTNVATLEYFTLTVFSFVFVERCFLCLAWVHRTLHEGGSF